MQRIKYGVIGASGRMGTEIRSLFSESGHECVFLYDINGETRTDNPALLIDFSLPDVFSKTAEYAGKFKVPLITGTTGLTPVQMNELKMLSSIIPVVQSNNFSAGIHLLLKCIDAVKDYAADWDIEITETHHHFKKDKPSGTALMIKRKLRENVPVSSLRLGGVPGDHSVYFGGQGEVLTIQHRALSRRTFAEGVLKSAAFIIQKSKGLYSFDDVMNNIKD